MEPFRDLNELGRGDQIEVEMPYDTFLYRMQRTQVVESNAFWVKGVLSIEHEDALASRDEGLEHALALLRRVTCASRPTRCGGADGDRARPVSRGGRSARSTTPLARPA